MARHFLQAGVLRDDLQDLLQHATYLKELLSLNPADREAIVAEFARQGFYTTVNEELEKAAGRVHAGAMELLDFLSQFPCEPLIYTGEGDTESVMALLEQLVTEHSQRATVAERRASLG